MADKEIPDIETLQGGPTPATTGDKVHAFRSPNTRVVTLGDAAGKSVGTGSGDVAAGDAVPVGYADLLTTVSLLALQVADNTNVALFLGSSGNRVADSFDALTYVDVAGATDLNSASPGLLKPTSTWTTYATTADPPLSSNGAGYGGFQYRWLIPASAISTSGSSIKLTLTPPTSGNNTTIANCFIGHAATAPNFDGNQKRVTFGGTNNTFLAAGGAAVVSDAIDFALDETKDLIVSMEYTGTTDVRLGGTTGYVRYEKAGSGEYASTSVTGYTTTAGAFATVDKIEVGTVQTTNNLTVRSAVFTAASVPTKMKAVLRVKEVDAAVAGTDYTLECSRDGGTTWSTMALTELFTSPSPTASIRVVEAAETSVSGQPSGTSPRWRFKTLNNKNVELHDVYLYWS